MVRKGRQRSTAMATIYDVAKETGFSLSTISNVLNNGPRPVRAETRERILAAVHRLNYHPSAVARGLALRRTHAIGILFGVVEPAAVILNAYSASVLQGVLTAAAYAGYNVTHYTEPWRDAAHSAAAYRDRRTDGLIVVAPPTDSDIAPTLASLDFPLIMVSMPEGLARVPSVDANDHIGARLAVEHLVSLGHTRIAHLMGHSNLLSAQIRRSVFEEVLQKHGIPIRPEYMLPGHYAHESGYENMSRLLALPEPPTAVFAANDEIAFGALAAASAAGVSIPGEVSLIGVDDRPPATLTSPPLTTIRQPFREIGEMATRLLIERIQGETVEPRTYLLPPELVVRGSTAPPPPSSAMITI